jgi:manganese/iron transport system substrate-binding protein
MFKLDSQNSSNPNLNSLKHRCLYIANSQLFRLSLPAIAVSFILAVSGCEQSASNLSTNLSNSAQESSSQKISQTLSTLKSKPKVVASTNVLCDLVKQIAADRVELTCLIEAGTDPHIYKSTPNDLKAIAAADLIFYAGYDFEPSIIKAVSGSKLKATKIAVSEKAVSKPLMEEENHKGESNHSDSDSTDKSGAEEKEVADPHVWNDPKNGKRMVEIIEQELIKTLPEQKATFEQRTKVLTTNIDRIDDWIKAQIATIPIMQRQLITTHDSLGYYGRAYNLEIKSVFEGISAEQKPSPTRIASLIKELKNSNVPTIFVEININPQLIRRISEETKVKVAEQELYGDGIGAKGSGSDTYQAMLISNTRTIVQGLGGKYIPFEPKTSPSP